MPCISTVTSSPTRASARTRLELSNKEQIPFLSQAGGFRAIATPAGVPVRITVPGNKVVSWDRNAISFAGLKIMSLVCPSCIFLPFTCVTICSLLQNTNTHTRETPGRCYCAGDSLRVKVLTQGYARTKRTEAVKGLATAPLSSTEDTQ